MKTNEPTLKALVKHRRELHKIPELGYDLPKTQAYVLEALKHTRALTQAVYPSGVLAYFDFGALDTIAFRADMDALPINEAGNAEYRSLHEGRMHACGHDGHMAILLTLAELIDQMSGAPHNALLIFQPAEESGNGAKPLIATGTLERYNVKRIFACHVEPLMPMGVIASRPGAFMARASEVHVHARGKSAHVARAKEGVDALELCARFYLEVLDHIAREYAHETHLIKFGMLKAGAANNILADSARLEGSLRAFDDSVFKRMSADIMSIANATATKFGGEINVIIDEGYPPLINDADCFERLARASAGEQFYTLPAPHMISEDFACYLARVPGLMFNVGLGSDAELHSPAFRFDERALLPGVNAFTRLFLDAEA